MIKIIKYIVIIPVIMWMILLAILLECLIDKLKIDLE